MAARARSGGLTKAALALLLAATVYEGLIATSVIHLGSEPDEGAQGSGIVLATGLGAILVGAALALAHSYRGPAPPFVELLAPASAAFLLARFYTFDPYYLPTLRRLSEDGLLSPVLVYALAGLAVLAGILVRLRVTLGLLCSAAAMLACALLAWVAAGGH
jgi:hypothetical protein